MYTPMCVYIYIYIYMYTHTYTYIYIYIYAGCSIIVIIIIIVITINCYRCCRPPASAPDCDGRTGLCEKRHIIQGLSFFVITS